MAELLDLIEERGHIVGCLVLTFGPFSNALVHMVQLLEHILAQLGLAVHGCQWVFTLRCGKRARPLHIADKVINLSQGVLICR